MLAFFRKVRKSLIGSSNLRRYLFYAIGEIALVVIGILIALKINNWNQYQQARQEEQRILTSISVETGNLSWQARRGLKTYQDIVQSSNWLLKAIHHPEQSITTDSLEYHLSIITNRWMFGKNNNTNVYDALTASGELKFIESDDLRTSLTTLDRQMVLLSVYEDIQTNFVESQLFPVLNTFMDGVNVYNARTDYLLQNYNYTPAAGVIALKKGKFITEINEIQKTKELSNLLANHIRNSSTLIPIYERIIQFVDRTDSLKNEALLNE